MLHCEEIDSLTDQEQADELVEHFSNVRNQYDELLSCDIQMPIFDEAWIPQISHLEVKKELENIKTNKSVPPGDIPPKVLKIFSEKLSKPITDIYNSSLRQGIWPTLWKREYVTPVAKVFPPKLKKEFKKHKWTHNFRQNRRKNHCRHDNRRHER